jgi:hypothetical protein
MTNYITRAHHYFGDDSVHVPNLSVIGSGPVRTGLLDQHGDQIWRSPEPVGFVTQFEKREGSK